MKNEVVPGMAEAIEARRKELEMTPGEFVAATGVTAPGLAPVRRGERRRYQESTVLAVCRVLRWTPDSLDRLMNGQPAVPLPTPPAPSVDTTQAAIDALEARLATLEHLVLPPAEQSGRP